MLGLQLALLFVAMRFGAGPEKWAASVVVAMTVISRAHFLIFEGRINLDTLNTGYFLIDLSVCVVLVVVALRANRMYTLWMAGFQFLAIFAHLARMSTDAISPITYAILVIGPSYFQTIILAFGIWFHHRRVKRHGNYRSWRSSSPLSPENVRPN